MVTRDLRSCLLHWHSACEHRAWRLSMLEISVQRRFTVMCRAVLDGWHGVVLRARLQQRGMDRLQQRQELGVLRVHLCLWHHAVVENRCGGGGRLWLCDSILIDMELPQQARAVQAH